MSPQALLPRAVGQRSETVRRANLSAIVRDLHIRGPLSRSDLVASTGLSRTTIRILVGELTQYGIATEERAASGGAPGRPSPLVRAGVHTTTVLALDIAVDSLAAAVVGLGGHILRSVRVDRPRGRSSVDDIIADLQSLARQLDVDLAGHSNIGSPIGIGVAVVGTVRRIDGFLPLAPNLGWRDVPLAEHLAKAMATSLPIVIGNEADLGALAELRRGAARGLDHVLYISGEVGVGGGLIADGRPLTGAAGFSGEVGHMPVNPAGIACACGSIGCWETEVGEGALLQLAGYSADAGRAGVDAVLRAAEAGDPLVLRALDAIGHWMGVGLAGLVNVFNPHAVVLGGLFGRIHPFIQDRLDRDLTRFALPASLGLLRVMPATLGIDASLLGAAELAFEPVLADPSTARSGAPAILAA